jgi:excinuclease ABC subunit C
MKRTGSASRTAGISDRSGPITSELLDIPGIGPGRRRALLERFGSLAGVRSATLSELAAVPGVSAGLADRIRAYLEAHP